jgi:Flp pilus assembly pilin Flp
MLLMLIAVVRTFATRVAERVESERGATMVEYALLVVGIAVAVGVAAAALGGRLVTRFNNILP